VLHRAEETISASVADADLAARLECEPGEPVLVVKRISWTPDDRVVESTRLLFVSERYEYRVAMQPPAGSGSAG
jgi:GntR family transcriptional regulator